MGKASRRHGERGRSTARAERAAAVPFVARPFQGLPAESDWVAIREILPAATATITLRPDAIPDGAPTEAVVATVLPLAWPALHRTDGTVFIATQTSGASGDPSRDLAAALLAALAVPAGTQISQLPPVTGQTPRLQDLIAEDSGFEVKLHAGFDFWVAEEDLTEDAAASLERANATVIPTTRMTALPAAYFVRVGDRTHIRLVLPDDEDAATDGLARLHSAGDDTLGDRTRLLGAFRAGGLLVPVWDLDPALEAADYEGELADFGTRYAAALAADAPLSPQERRARSGLLSRQVTLR